MKSEIILDTPNRNEILKEGPPENSNCNILGRGSYGVVFKAIYGGQQVAVKIMKNSINGKADTISNEANILGCRHRNIVQILKIESTANYGIVIMERFPGQCLQIILDSIALPLEHRIFVSLDIANALIYCHRRQILHLDVKPQNILLSFSTYAASTKHRDRRLSAACVRGYICKLCDFGSSAKASDNGHEKPSKPIQGTVRYMSTEALRQDVLSPAADVFSLGVTMWQLKYRELPYAWIQCNDIVAYQVVKTHLRPTDIITQSYNASYKLVANSIHKNCLCENFSSEISHRSIDNIRAIFEKNKTLSPHAAGKSLNHRTPEKLRKQISRSLIGTFQSTFKENLLVDKISCDILEDECQNNFPLKEMFMKMPVLFLPRAEALYEELFTSCWHNESKVRPKTTEVKKRLLSLLSN